MLMSQLVGFKFPYDQSDQWDGFNDSGMEHFSGNPYVHLGREVVQNTIDAKQEGSTSPARIFIQLIDVPTDSIPDVASLRSTLQSCSIAAKNESEKAKIFFENALELLTKTKITVLKISEFNTTGVCAHCGARIVAVSRAQLREVEAMTVITTDLARNRDGNNPKRE
jgi:hypothetical protein